MARYRKRIIEVEAVQFNKIGDSDAVLSNWIPFPNKLTHPDGYYHQLKSGPHLGEVKIGDMIVTYPDGYAERYSPNDFIGKFEPI